MNNIIQCSECRLNLASFLAVNYNNFPYGQMQRFVQPQPLFDPSLQMPFIRKKNNNKNNKNLSVINNFKQNEKNEENENDENNISNYGVNKKKEENIPQSINSFYFLNESLRKQEIDFNESSIYNNEENNSNNNIINKLKRMSKSKEKKNYKKNIFILNKNLLQILENFDLTNEEKLLYILENYKNAKIDPVILKVLEFRKNNKKNGTNENKNLNIVNGNQNNFSIFDNGNAKLPINKKYGINNEANNTQTFSNENNSYIPPQPVRISFPMDDKKLFKDLEKYKISPDILDRPTPVKIDLDFSILNKLFIIWDFLITFKDTVFSEKALESEIDKNILVFYSNLLDEKNNFQYYKNVLISLLLLCIKNIPYAIQSPRTPRLFLLKSILDNLHSMSYNIIYDSPMVVLKEIIESYLYNNSIENNNMIILNNILINVNNPKNKENFENNKNIFEKEEIKEDNIGKIDNDTKVFLLHIIIGLCFETLIIKEKIRCEYDNMNSLTLTKKGLDESLLDTEKRLKELNRMENFKTLPKEIEILENKLKELKEQKMDIEKENEGNENEEKNNKEREEEKSKQENNNKENDINNINKEKQIQELESQIEKYKNILNENEKLLEKKKEINNKITEIIENIYNLKTLRKKYLGIDYQNNEYYYFTSVPDNIFTKNKKRKEWAYFENKEDIQTLINKLTEKGKNEKNLKVILKFIFSQMKEREQKEKEKQKQKELEEEKKKKEMEEKMKNNNTAIEGEKQQNNENNKDQIQIKIEKNQKNENENGEIKEKITEHVINLGVSPKKRGKNKPKEEEKIDNIHILEDDEEEIVENKEIQDSKEKDSNSQIKNKPNNIIKKEKDIDIKDNKLTASQTKNILLTFVLSEERLQLNVILINIDYVFSEYLIQFNKQWESEKNRNKWKEILTNNATDKNILASLKMFNHKFKNPYKILSLEEEQELLLKEKVNKGNNFIFDEENGNKFSIPETNNLLLLSPKVKIWSKEMDLIDIDNFYNNDLLINVYSREQLCYIVHFYEMAIFGLVHRREGKRKL